MDKKFIIILLILLLLSISKSFATNINKIDANQGIISLMYHRFDENKYPSTNIKKEVFLEHLKIISSNGIEFISFKKFKNLIVNKIDKNYILLTIDDAFHSFYVNAWPILKSKNIPFILFVNTREVGSYGYMSWDQILEVQKSGLGTIGNHSHSHDYLVDFKEEEIKLDLETSIKIFNEKIGYSPIFFSYPFGEYSNTLKKIVSDLNFEFAFGQHSGVIDISKKFLELPRFPINEKYGELKRFKFLLQTLPFPYKSIVPNERYISEENNPPKVKIKFFENVINIENINCYSNEGNVWKKSEIKFLSKNEIAILFKEKFRSERGRINCSLQTKNGKWRWLGIQYVVEKY